MARGRSYSADLLTMMPFHPFVTPSPLSHSGMPAGINQRVGRRELMDRYRMQTSGDSKSTLDVYAGVKRSGKTTSMKYHTLLDMAVQSIDETGNPVDATLHIDNRKPEEGVAEWASIVEAMACEVTRLQDMGIEAFDPLTLRSEWERLQTAINIVEFEKQSMLSINEALGLRIAVFVLTRDTVSNPKLFRTRSLEARCRKLSEQDIIDFFGRLDDLAWESYRVELDANPLLYKQFQHFMLQPDNIIPGDIQAGAAEVAKYLGMILDGRYGGMFGGSKSLRDFLCQPAALFDLSGVDLRTRNLFEMLRHDAKSAAMNHGDLGPIPNVHVREEMQEESEDLVALRSHAFWSAKARAAHVIEKSSTQYLGNLRAGEPGSMTRLYSEQIYSGTDGFWLFQQDDGPTTRYELEQLGLSEQDIQASYSLGTGCAIVKYRDRPPLPIQVVPPKMLLDMAKSSGATQRQVNRKPVLEHPHVQAVLERQRTKPKE